MLSTVLTLAFGLFPTWVLARYRFAGRSILVALVTVPFVLPTIAVGAAFLAVEIGVLREQIDYCG